MAIAHTVSCQSPRTVYLVESVGIAPLTESSTWLGLSVNDINQSDPQSFEAVIPAAVGWTVRDLSLSAQAGIKVKRFAMQRNGSNVVSASVCFTSWDEVKVLKLSPTPGAVAKRADLLAEGVYGIAPTAVQPGGTITVLVLQGSYQDALFQQKSDGTSPLNWYAVPQRSVVAVFPVSLAENTAYNMKVYTLAFPRTIPSGTYLLAPLPANLVKHLTPGFLNGSVVADFTVQVR